MERPRRVSRLRHAAQVLEPSLMAPREHPAQVPSREHRHPSALRLLRDHAASRTAGFECPSVIGVEPGCARVPSEFAVRLEHPYYAAHACVERAPLETAAGGQIRSALLAGIMKARAVAVPLRPALAPD